MGFFDTIGQFGEKVAGGIVGKGNDFHYQGAHDWLFGGTATKGINTQLGGYDAAQAQLSQLGQAQAPTAQAAALDRTQLDQSRAGLMGVTNRLGAVAGGQQAGAGELAVNRQLGQANAAQVSAARMAHGANAALAYRNAMRNQADMGLAGAGQAAQAQMQDQQAANAQLGQLYGGMYGQDTAVAQANANYQQQTNMANQQAALQSRALQI